MSDVMLYWRFTVIVVGILKAGIFSISRWGVRFYFSLVHGLCYIELCQAQIQLVLCLLLYWAVLSSDPAWSMPFVILSCGNLRSSLVYVLCYIKLCQAEIQLGPCLLLYWAVQRWDPARDALLLKQTLEKQTVFILLLKQNKSDLLILHQNQNKSNLF